MSFTSSPLTLGALLFLLFCLIGEVATAQAPTSPRRPIKNIDSEQRTLMDRGARERVEDALGEGYRASAVQAPPGILEATLWAAGPGLLIHGAGHWRLGDQAGALRILGLEGIGATILVSGLALREWGEGEHILQSGRLFSQLGVSLLATSWLADLSGSIRGMTTPQKIRNERSTPRLTTGYILLQDESISSQNHLHFGATFQLPGELTLEPTLVTELQQDQLLWLELSLRRWFQGGEALFAPNWWALHFENRRLAWYAERLTQLRSVFSLEGRWRLTHLGRGLDHMSIAQKVGLGVNGYQLSLSDRSPRWLASPEIVRPAFLLRSQLLFDSSTSTRFQIAFTHDPGALVRPISSLFGFFEVGAELLRQEQFSLITNLQAGESLLIQLSLSALL